MIPGVLPDELQEYPADGPIAMEHPLLGDPVLRDGMARLSSHRNGFFQKLSLTATWLHSGNDPQDFGFTEIDAFASFALPFPITAWPLVITPGYNMHLLTGPESPDLPARLNDAYLDFMWLPTIINRYTLLLAVTPGYYSDFQVRDADAFRVTGKGLLIFATALMLLVAMTSPEFAIPQRRAARCAVAPITSYCRLCPAWPESPSSPASTNPSATPTPNGSSLVLLAAARSSARSVTLAHDVLSALKQIEATNEPFAPTPPIIPEVAK